MVDYSILWYVALFAYLMVGASIIRYVHKEYKMS